MRSGVRVMIMLLFLFPVGLCLVNRIWTAASCVSGRVLALPRPGLACPRLCVLDGRLAETLAERLRPRVILGRPDVDEHSILFGGVHPVVKQSRKDILLEACWSVRDVFEHGALEKVHSAVNDSRCPDVVFLDKADDSLPRIESHRS